MMAILMVALGGALGSVCRHGFAQWLPPSSFPWRTLVINALGSLLLALMAGFWLGSENASTNTRLFWMTGVMGGFTTYSTFNLEVIEMLQVHDPGRALMYLLATILTALLPAWAVFYHALNFAG